MKICDGIFFIASFFVLSSQEMLVESLPWIMQACHLTAAYHLGAARTRRTLERFSWWIGRRVFHPLVTAPLPEVLSADDTAIHGLLADSLDSLPCATGHCGQRGLSWALFLSCSGVTSTYRFSPSVLCRHAGNFAATAAELTVKNMANVLNNRSIPLWGCPRSISSNNDL